MAPEREGDWLDALDRRLLGWFWRSPRRGGLAGLGQGLLRVVHLSLRNSWTDRVPFSANALTFITLLGMVPALAISFSLAKGLRFATPRREYLLHNEFLVSQREVLERLVEYVERTSVGTLGMVGLAVLVATLVFTLSTVEDVFNRIWEARESRGLLRRVTDYVAVLVICPILVMAASASWAAFSSHGFVQWLLQMEVVGEVAQLGMGLGPFVLLVAAFVFLYLFLPNTRVPFFSALLAGAVAGGLWWLVQTVYIVFQVGVTRYNAIYGGFASLPLFMVWLQVSWMVLLYGAELARAHHVCRHGPPPAAALPPFTPAQREALGLLVYLRVARAFSRGEAPLTSGGLARGLGMPRREIHRALAKLRAAGLVSRVGADGVLPARSLEGVSLALVWEALRGAGSAPSPGGEAPPGDARLLALWTEAACAMRRGLELPIPGLLAGEAAPLPASPCPPPEGDQPRA